MADIVIRPYVETDAPGLEEVAMAACGPADDLLDHAVWGEARDEPRFSRTFVASHAGEQVGFVTVYQNAFHYHLRDFRISLAVQPQFQRRGIGGALHRAAVDALSESNGGHGLARLRTLTRDGSEAANSFLQGLAYRRLLLSYRPTLAVGSALPRGLECIRHTLAAAGYTVHTLDELADEGIADLTIVELCLEAYGDIHTHSPPTGTAEAWHRVFLGDGCIREAFFVVLKEGRPVAFSSLQEGDEPGNMELMWDGVARSERAVEVPLRAALKVRELEFARGHGVHRLVWEVDSVDLAGMRLLELFPFDRGVPFQMWVNDFPTSISATKRPPSVPVRRQ